MNLLAVCFLTLAAAVSAQEELFEGSGFLLPEDTQEEFIPTSVELSSSDNFSTADDPVLVARSFESPAIDATPEQVVKTTQDIVEFAQTDAAVARTTPLRTSPPSSEEAQAEILLNEFIMDDEGGYSSQVETSNQIRQTASGESIPGAEPETGSFVMRGEYSYIAPDGQVVKVTWFADETGFHPTSDAIPVA